MKDRHILRLPHDGLASVPKEDRPRIRKALCQAAGKTYEDLAVATKKSQTYIQMILDDDRTGYTIRPVIAQILGFRVADLWPDTPLKYQPREAA